jgi:hypothetical protein
VDSPATEDNGLAIELFPSEYCMGPLSSPSARGVCNVIFFDRSRSVCIIKVPTAECAIGFCSRGYCNDGNDQNGNYQALHLYSASIQKGGYRSNAEPGTRQNMQILRDRSIRAVSKRRRIGCYTDFRPLILMFARRDCASTK